MLPRHLLPRPSGERESNGDFQRAFRWACALDVQARKPGNVSFASSGHGMQAGLFIASADAAAGPLCTPGLPVGARIEAAMHATLAVAHCNTNLGILLLCAPLAAACESWSRQQGLPALRQGLEGVLQSLGVADARAAYRAIAAAQPGGLGDAAQQDVRAEPTIGLRDTMALAADRDRIAFQYQHAHADVFDLGLPAFMAQPQATGTGCVAAMQRCFVELLAAFADSHIVRKHGAATAHSVMAEARPWRDRARAGHVLDADPDFAAWDVSLKSRHVNPGTSADLSVATALVAALAQGII
jgi:triphosphoribosyl-dephospho-CoA synthase